MKNIILSFYIIIMNKLNFAFFCASTEHLDECLCLEINKLFEHARIEESVGQTPLNSLSRK